MPVYLNLNLCFVFLLYNIVLIFFFMADFSVYTEIHPLFYGYDICFFLLPHIIKFSFSWIILSNTHMC